MHNLKTSREQTKDVKLFGGNRRVEQGDVQEAFQRKHKWLRKHDCTTIRLIGNELFAVQSEH